jgi:Ni,Fe-hydrogenase III large subunit/Ni,Fe-hydrogenase III component G
MSVDIEEIIREAPSGLAIRKERDDGTVHMTVDTEGFADLVAYLHARGGRLVSLHAADRRAADGAFTMHALIDLGVIVEVECAVRPDRASFHSLAPRVNAANWYEREVQDMFGLVPDGHPDPRPLVLYDDWPEGIYPLRKDFDPSVPVPRVPREYRFRRVEGEGVHEIPVGPVHAGVIEPGHFRFSAAGEPIIALEVRLGYVHRGVEKLSESIPYRKGVFLAERISGDASAAHSTAYCQAVERLCGAEVPERAEYIRTVVLEMERLYNHIGDIAGIALDTAFAVPAADGLALKERVLELNERLTGSRLLRSVNDIGGVTMDVSREEAMKVISRLVGLRQQFEKLAATMFSSTSMLDRVEGTGRLDREKARPLGCVGPVARASGIDMDARRDHPYAAYRNLSFRVPVRDGGDVDARTRVRVDEVRESFAIIEQALDGMPGGPLAAEVKEVPAGRTAFSLVEAPRGEVMHWIISGDGTPFRHKIRDPSFCNWLGMEFAVRGNIVPDFPLINKSFGLSYAGNDL